MLAMLPRASDTLSRYIVKPRCEFRQWLELLGNNEGMENHREDIRNRLNGERR